VAAQLGNGSSDLLREGGAEEIVEVEEASQAAWRRVSGGVFGGRCFSSIWKRSRQPTCYFLVLSLIRVPSAALIRHDGWKLEQEQEQHSWRKLAKAL